MLESGGESSGLTMFMAGITLGVLIGLFFASYLVKLGRLNGKKGSSEFNYTAATKKFSADSARDIKHSNSAASVRTGSTRSADSDEAGEETEKLL